MPKDEPIDLKAFVDDPTGGVQPDFGEMGVMVFEEERKIDLWRLVTTALHKSHNPKTIRLQQYIKDQVENQPEEEDSMEFQVKHREVESSDSEGELRPMNSRALDLLERISGSTGTPVPTMGQPFSPQSRVFKTKEEVLLEMKISRILRLIRVRLLTELKAMGSMLIIGDPHVKES